MTTELEKLPRLLERAVATLNKATTSAEILEAKRDAGLAYNMAKVAAYLEKLKDAHSTIVGACRKIMADALVIEARAQCRLADEYDAAQERGEIRTAGQPRKRIFPNENNSLSFTDIGLTGKQVHEARQVRDLEKSKPGIIRKTLDDKLEAGEEPMRADINRIINKPRASKLQPQRRKNTSTSAAAAARSILDGDKSYSDVENETGLSSTVLRSAVAREEGRREADAKVDPATLSMTAQEKLNAAMRQQKRKLEEEFETRVLEECRRRLNDISLPHYAKELAELERSISNRKGIMDRVTYRKILACLHPDRVPDAALKRRYEEAFRLFTELEKRVLDEKESPTQFRKMPRTYEELMAMRAKVQAERRAKRAKSGMTVRH